MRVCDQLEGQLVDRESLSANEFTVSALQQELQQKDAEIQSNHDEMQRKDAEMQRKDGEIQQKDIEIQRNIAEIQHLTTALRTRDKDVTLETLKSNVSKLQTTTSQLSPNKVYKQCIVIHYHYLYDVF